MHDPTIVRSASPSPLSFASPPPGRPPTSRPGAGAGSSGARRGSSGSGGGIDWGKIITAFMFVVLIGTGAAFMVNAVVGPQASLAPSPSGTAGAVDPSGSATGPTADPSGSIPAESPDGSAPPTEPTPTPVPTPEPTAEVAMPIVPVVSYWSTQTSISEDALRSALTGRSERYSQVIVPAEDRDAIARAVGIDGSLADSVQTGTVEEIRAAVKDGALGILRAADVTPAVRALGVGGRALFGNDRIETADAWPYLIQVVEPVSRQWDQGATWTLAAGGDMLLDRGVYLQAILRGQGPDYMFDGGTAEITGRRCCSPFFNDTYVLTRRTGNKGMMRDFLTKADIAVANLENPTPKNSVFHEHGTRFTGDQRLVPGIKRSGIDIVSLANNHIGDAGAKGIKETRQLLDELGILHMGAGNLSQIRQPAVMDAAGTRVAFLACDAIAGVYAAREGRVGSSSCRTNEFTKDIRAAKQTHDVVVVMPHWGVEYRVAPTEWQRKRAARWIRAGADVIIGGHSHWAGAMEEIDGKLVFYSLGNFVFDQWFTEPTSQGLVTELTWHGSRLVQGWIHPHQILEQGQPNFMDPAGDGKLVLRQVRQGSRGMLPY